MFTAKLNHCGCARHAQLCFQGTGFVIDAGMDDAAVVAALMTADVIFFLEQKKAHARKSPRDFERHRQADNSAADDNDAVARLSHGSSAGTGLLRGLVCSAFYGSTIRVTVVPFGWLMLGGEPITVIV